VEPSKPDLEAILGEVPSRPTASTLFNLAHAYAMASDTIWSRLALSKNADFAGPGIMCQAFAIELLLKFFLVIEHGPETTLDELARKGIKLRGHSFSALFDRVSDEFQGKIAESYTTLTGEPCDPAGFRETLVRTGDDPFVSWRYIYESTGISQLNKALVDQVTDALGKAAETERRAHTREQ